MPAEQFAFWLSVVALSGFVLAMMLPALLGRRRTGGGSHAAFNAAVHRAQLAELDEALFRGAIPAREHRAEADEVLRRVLAENGDAAAAAPRAVTRKAALALLALPLVALALYWQIGNPGAVGMTAADATTTLENHLQKAPKDGRAWVALARLMAEQDRFASAAEAYERALQASVLITRDPQIWCELADALALQQGTLNGRPRALIEHALAIDPLHPRALEMAGSAAVDARDYAAAVVYWGRLLEQLEDPPERAKLQLAMQKARALARDFKPPVSPAKL